MALSDSLFDPQLTEGYAIFIIGILSILLYSGMKLYSTIVIASWGITVIIFIGVGLYNLPITLFYFGIICTCMLVSLAGVRYSQIS